MIKGCRLLHLLPRGQMLHLALVLLLLSSCGSVTNSATGKIVTQQQQIDRLVIALGAPAQPRLLTEEQVVITLTDAAGKPVEGAQVWLGLVMPAMQHSPNEPDAVAAGQGRYAIRALFTMTGT